MSKPEPNSGITYLDEAAGAQGPEAETATQEPAAEVVDAQIAPPSGKPCPGCGWPVEAADRFCPSCGRPHEPTEPPSRAAAADEEAKKFFRCENCGAEVATDPDQRSYVCPFCDSTYVVEFAGRGRRQRPEFVIGFAITPAEAEQRFRRWLGENAWFRPGDLKTARIEEKLRGIYLPFWSFSMLAESRWSSRIGEYWYRTETYTTTDSKGRTVTRTRRVRETEWWPLEGYHHQYYSGYLVSGSKGLPQREAARIQPFQLPALRRYEPYYLAGWLSEEYSVEGHEALQTCCEHFRGQEQNNIAAFLPGDTHRGLVATTHFSHMHSDLCLLPVYLLSYRYGDKLYRFLLNGQTGRMAGDKPLSRGRIGAAIAGGVALVLLLVLLMLLFGWMTS